MNRIQFKDLGTQAYQKALAIQITHFEYLKNIKIRNRGSDKPVDPPHFFFFVSHPHVYTMGKNADEKNVLFSTQQLADKHIEYVRTNRGGDVTYHGPGQIVGYPIIDLDQFKADIHGYMRSLEEVIIRVIAEYGLKGERSQGETGVWLDVGSPFARKICAMGVHTSRWVTMHGFALNVNTDLNYFTGIIPCGIQNKGVTSLQNELQTPIDEQEVKKLIQKHFEEVFHCKFIPYSRLDA